MQASEKSTSKLLFQIAGAAVSSFAVLLQLYLIIRRAYAEGIDYTSEVIRFFSYMTIWTNILVVLFFLVPLIAPKSGLNRFLEKPIAQGGTLLYVCIVGLVYHFLLASLWSPTGLQLVADTLLHYLDPILYVLYWAVFLPKGNQKYGNPFKWLIYPLVYIIYSLIRGAISNVYPYPFIDVLELGWPLAFRNMVLLSIAYYISGLLIVLIDNLVGKRPA